MLPDAGIIEAPGEGLQNSECQAPVGGLFSRGSMVLSSTVRARRLAPW